MAPSGLRGVHSRAERRALVRLDQPLQHLAAAADRRLLGADVADLEAVLGVVRRGSARSSRQPLCGIIPIPRQARSVDLEDVLEHRSIATGFPSAATARA